MCNTLDCVGNFHFLQTVKYFNNEVYETEKYDHFLKSKLYCLMAFPYHILRSSALLSYFIMFCICWVNQIASTVLTFMI